AINDSKSVACRVGDALFWWQKQEPRQWSAGALFAATIVTILKWPAAAEMRGYQDDRLPVAPRQQVRDARGCPSPAARNAAHILTPARWLRSVPEPSASRACAPAAAALQASRDPTRGPRSAARCPHRGGRDRHWRGAATATAGSSAGVPPPIRRGLARPGPGESRLEPASAGPRTWASAASGPRHARPPAE